MKTLSFVSISVPYNPPDLHSLRRQTDLFSQQKKMTHFPAHKKRCNNTIAVDCFQVQVTCASFHPFAEYVFIISNAVLRVNLYNVMRCNHP